MCKKIDMAVIVPGSFDPPTLGHVDIIRRAAEKYREVYAVVFNNPEKEYVFTPTERVSMLMLATDSIPNVLVSFSAGLVIDYMRDHGIEKIVKGIRNQRDLEYEKKMAEWNLKMGGYETELLQSDSKTENISSTLARELLLDGKDLSSLLPKAVADYIKNSEKYGKN